jgi:hypothetical protein
VEPETTQVDPNHSEVAPLSSSSVQPPRRVLLKALKVTAAVEFVLVTRESLTQIRMAVESSSISAVSFVSKMKGNRMAVLVLTPAYPMNPRPGRSIIEPRTRGIQLVCVSALKRVRSRSVRPNPSADRRPRLNVTTGTLTRAI